MSTSSEHEEPASVANEIAASQTNRIDAAPGEGKEKGVEKTISCVSCRRRKLKCDRAKPKCGTCGRLRHECEYPERRRNIGTKRRNMKELEARLAQVESQLVAETQQMAANKAAETKVKTNTNVNPDWSAMNMDMDLTFTDAGLQDLGFDLMNENMGAVSSVPAGIFFSQEILSLGLQEPLPPESLMDDLYRIYFERFHPTLPMIHKGRFYASLNMPTNHKPPIALRYAMMTVAASFSDNYQTHVETFYERARRYAEIAEMQGQGAAFVCVQSVQTWAIISSFEATNAYFSRAWMSTGRCARLCLMLSLQRIDAVAGFVGKRILPPAKDWIELEERRRSFWAAYFGDRWASCATGWPMMFDDEKIKTNMPCSNDAFDLGMEEKTCSLAEALTPEGASTISSFAGVVLSACLFGQNIEHMSKSGPEDGANDVANGEFWKKHRKLDNILSSTFMFLPDSLRLPVGLRDPNIIFFHMNIHCSTICLHQGAVMTAEREDLSQSLIQQSEARNLMAAEEVANLMRLISHVDPHRMTSWVGYCLYIAAGVFLQDLRKDKPSTQSSSNLDFLMSALKAVGKKHLIARHFAVQLELEIETRKTDYVKATHNFPSSCPSGSLVKENGDLCPFPRSFKPKAPGNDSSRSSIDTSQSRITTSNTPPQTTQQTQIETMSQVTPASYAPTNFSQQLRQQPDSGSETIDTDFTWSLAGNTPPSDSSTSNATYPYRNPKSTNLTDSNGNWIFNPDAASRFPIDPLSLNISNSERNLENNNLPDNEILNSLINSTNWDPTFHISRHLRQSGD